MHRAVMLKATVDLLAVRPGGSYVDATLGGGGHAAEILRRAAPDGRLLGIDRDPAALARAGELLRTLPGEVRLLHGNHHDLDRLARAAGFAEVDGVVIDTGVSSDQLDEAARGFSFQQDGPLDMRMDPTQGETAAALLARLEPQELATLLRELGEEPQAGRIARAIDRERRGAPLTSTLQLAELVTRAVGGRRDRRRHPATRVFQALRMAVNGELEALSQALDAAINLLRPGGRLAVISFESLSDRIVKHCFTSHAGREAALPQGGVEWQGSRPPLRWVERRFLRPDEEEQAANPRARSAKLRVVRRLTPDEESAA